MADLGLLGLHPENAGTTGGFPYFDFSEGTNYAFTYRPRSALAESRNYQLTDALIWVRGRHINKFGTDLRRIGYRSVLHNGNGADDFGGFYFSSTDFSGNAFADLLLGIPTQSYYAVVGPNVNGFAGHAGFFVSDTWRASARVTVELGLRWEVHPPMSEEAGNIANFDRANGNVIVPDRTLPAAPGFLAAIRACTATTGNGCTNVLTASQAGLPQTLRTTDHSGWNPRIGLAWQPGADGKTVVRAGLGIYTFIPLGGTAFAPTGIHSSDVRDVYNALDQTGRPLVTLPNILPAPDALGAVGRETFLSANDPGLRDPRSYQWNFTVERALPWSASLRTSYIGVQSIGIPARVDFNQVPASTTPFSWDRVPYRQWGYLGSVENVGFANYQGLQIEATRRTRGGVYLQGTFSHSKNLGAMGSAGSQNFAPEATGIGVSDRFNTRYDRGNLSAARRDRFLFTAIVPLPFGSLRAVGTSALRIRQMVLGGWELSTVSLAQTGPFLTPVIASGLDQSNTNLSQRTFNVRPDRVGNGNLSNPAPDRYFDKSAFAAVPRGAGRFGNSGAGVLVGPGTVAVALGISKAFVIRESMRLRLEGTFTNLPNHPNFLPPVTNISQPAFGRLTSVQSAENSGNRTGQIAARIDF